MMMESGFTAIPGFENSTFRESRLQFVPGPRSCSGARWKLMSSDLSRDWFSRLCRPCWLIVHAALQTSQDLLAAVISLLNLIICGIWRDDAFMYKLVSAR